MEEDRDIARDRNRRFAWIAGGGCLILTLLIAGVVALLLISPLAIFSVADQEAANESEVRQVEEAVVSEEVLEVQGQIDPLPAAERDGEPLAQIGLQGASLEELYQEVNAGVVSIQVLTSQQGLAGAGAGSGFIISEDGYIVTNYHVVQQAEDVTVVSFDGTQVAAEVVGVDPESDLAVIQVETLPENTHPIPIGDSDTVNPGQWVVAIGNPFGLASSMSAGIVSATGRTIPAVGVPFSIPEAIQTDAAINPGNSGGPLLNLNGEVIGVNAQIRTGGGVAANVGVGFAIPSNIVRRVVPVLIEAGEFQWPWLGVSGRSVTLAIAEENNLETQEGAYIAEVVAGGPADEAGIQGAEEIIDVNGIPIPIGGDVIVESDGERVETFDELLTIIASHSPGDVVEMVILRDGETFDTTVELAPRPDEVDVTFP